MSPARLSLADQLLELEEAAEAGVSIYTDSDPEDVQKDRIDHEELVPPTVTHSAREHYFTVGPSTLRKLNDSISDPKYDGVRTTRKQLMDDSDGDANTPHESEEGERSPFSHQSVDEHQDSNVPQLNSPTLDQPVDQVVDQVVDQSSTLQETREQDRQKGKAIARQIAIWDALVDARIRLQKSVAAANLLPAPSVHSRIIDSPECQDPVNEMLEQATLLSNDLLALQEDLLALNEPIEAPARKKFKPHSENGETPIYETELLQATDDVMTLENAMHPHMLQTLSKWSSKIQAVTPSTLLPPGRNALFSKSSQRSKTAVQLIDELLTDQPRLLARTQYRRGKGVRIGNGSPREEDGGKNEQVDKEIFDDTDFYQQLLREVIDARGNDIDEYDDWITQTRRKVKKKVDTKASKGRKLRYETHEKIQNFMVPVPVSRRWHEEKVNELIISLFGPGKL